MLLLSDLGVEIPLVCRPSLSSLLRLPLYGSSWLTESITDTQTGHITHPLLPPILKAPTLLRRGCVCRTQHSLRSLLRWLSTWSHLNYSSISQHPSHPHQHIPFTHPHTPLSYSPFIPDHSPFYRYSSPFHTCVLCWFLSHFCWLLTLEHHSPLLKSCSPFRVCLLHEAFSHSSRPSSLFPPRKSCSICLCLWYSPSSLTRRTTSSLCLQADRPGNGAGAQ